MRNILAAALIVAATLLGSCNTAPDCCEALYEAGKLRCQRGESREECIATCTTLCEATIACYCTYARQIGASPECGCD